MSEGTSPPSRPRPPWLFALIGVWIGIVIVLTAWVFAVELVDRGWTLQSILIAHQQNPLFWFVDVTPLYLGWLGWILGLNEQLYHALNRMRGRLMEQPTLETPTPRPLSEEPTLDMEDDHVDAVTTVDREPAHTAFVARFAHELRTPLNAIIGYGEMALEDLEDRDGDPLVADMRKVVAAGHHLLDLLDTVLDLARIQSNRLSVALEAVAVDEVVEDALNSVAPLAQENGNQLVSDLPAERTAVRADPMRLRQVLINLLGNACKFTRDGRVRVVVEPGIGPSEGFVLIQVEDTGIGMSVEQQARLYREFSQGEGIAEEFGGTGLGLAISKRLIELMGGRIGVQSTEGKGSTFTLYMPRSDGRHGVLAEPGLTQEHRKLAPEEVRPETHVLVIHPDRSFRDLVRNALASVQYRVTFARTGAEGLDRARELPVSTVVVGHGLPDLAALDVIMALKERRGGDRLPVLFAGPASFAALAVGAGAAEAVTEPVDFTDLVRLLKRYRMRRIGCSILLVEPEPELGRPLQAAFRRDGWSPDMVRDGARAVEGWRGDPPDMVVVDLGATGEQGAEFLEGLSHMETWAGVPVLAFAGRTVVGWDLRRLSQWVDRVVVCGSDIRDEVIRSVRDGVGDLLASVERERFIVGPDEADVSE